MGLSEIVPADGLKNDILDIRNAFSKQQTAATVQMMRSAMLPCLSLASSSGREMVGSALSTPEQVLQGGRSSNAVDWQVFLQDLYSASRVMQQACDEQLCWKMENTAVTANSKYAIANLLEYFFLAQYLRSGSDLRDVLSSRCLCLLAS